MTEFERISEHVYWMKAGPPDRPSLAAVVGERFTLMLDAGASDAHARLFLDALKSHGIPMPRYVALTHWHWDHVFGAAEIGVPIIAHRLTHEALRGMVGLEWSDAALDARVESGEEIPFCADNIKLELPEPRAIRIALPEIIVNRTLHLDLGDVTCHIQHVGGDHAADSCVMTVLPDQIVFLGDCLYEAVYAPVRHYSQTQLSALLQSLSLLDAALYIEGHGDKLLSRAEFRQFTEKLTLASELAAEASGDAQAALQLATGRGITVDEDLQELIASCAAGFSI